MAHYRVAISTHNRRRGPAVLRAAYRAGERLTAEADYSRKTGVREAWLALPEGAPAWAKDRAALWLAADRAEVRCDARVAREVLVSLPCELSAEGQVNASRAIGAWLCDRYRVAVDCAVHEPPKRGDARHVHLHALMTTRRLEGDRGLTSKSRELDARATGPAEVRAIRAAVAECINRELARELVPSRVEHRSKRAIERTASRTQAQSVAVLKARIAHLHRKVRLHARVHDMALGR